MFLWNSKKKGVLDDIMDTKMKQFMTLCRSVGWKMKWDSTSRWIEVYK